jgi:nitrogen fixation protein NifX
MKVAYATTDGVNVDEHFGRCGRFVIYEFAKEGYERAEERVFSEGRDEAVESTKGMGPEHDDAVNAKIEKLSDCSIICVTNIGGPSAARLSRKGIIPVKVKEVTGIDESARRLMETIKGSPPPWLRKLING